MKRRWLRVTPFKPWAGTRSPTPLVKKTPDMYHHSTLQGIHQGNLSSGIEKIAKNNDLSKVKNDYWGLAGLQAISNRPDRHNRSNRLNRTKKSPASVPCWQVVLNLVRPGGVPVGPLGASYKTTRHTVPRKGSHSINVGSRTCCQSPTPQGLCFPCNTICLNFFSSLSSMRSSGCPMPSSTTPHRGNVGFAKKLPSTNTAEASKTLG